MTDNELMKSADNETVKQRVKAIYPHITVSGAIDKPYYNIDWYDIEKNTMYRGFSSYNLELVHKWLEEEFEVVEADIDNLINRQRAEIEQLKIENRILSQKRISFPERLEIDRKARAEAVKEFAERLTEISSSCVMTHDDIEIYGTKTYTFKAVDLDNLVKEMVGEG